MSRKRMSLPGRRVHDGTDTSAVELILIEITHPDLAAPLRFSTDMTERLTNDPRTYGTRSTWRGANPATEPFEFIPAEYEWPGDAEDEGPEARLILPVVTPSMIMTLRGFNDPATLHLALVISTHADEPEEELLGMELQMAEADLTLATQIELSLSHRLDWLEMFPSPRMTRSRCPGLNR